MINENKPIFPLGKHTLVTQGDHYPIEEQYAANKFEKETAELERLKQLCPKCGEDFDNPKGYLGCVCLACSDVKITAKPRLVIVINGGCVVNVYASQDQAVEILDRNDLEEQSPGPWVDVIVKESTTGLKEIY